MLNQWIGVGRWTEEIRLSYTPSGKAVASGDLAINEGYGDKESTSYHKIVMWEKLAENVANYSGKGRLVLVVGRYTHRTYDGSDGQKRKVSEVVASTVHFLDKSHDDANAAPKATTSMGKEVPDFNDDDVPFAP